MNSAQTSQHLLVAEDDPLVSELIRRILMHAGYEVTVCPDGQAALETLQENPERFALLLSDIRMPRLSGFELTHMVSQHYPKLPILLASGYPDDYTQLQNPSLSSTAFLTKPFRATELIALVNQLIHDANPPSRVTH